MVDQETNTGRQRASGRKIILWATMILLTVLAVLSIGGAFLGAQRATVLFNLPPLVVFWILLAAVFVAGFLSVKSLFRRPGLLLCHLGCLLVMLGAMWGSRAAHELRARYMGATKVREGYMQIHEGHQENQIYSGNADNAVLATLPFNVALDDFWIEYYESAGRLHVAAPNDQSAVLEAVAGKKADFGPDTPRVEIIRSFENFKILMEAGRNVASDAGGVGVNPALEVEITATDGSKSTRYVFARSHADHEFSYEGLNLAYEYGGGAAIKDYKSSLTVLEGGQVVMRKVIEVNKPLNYGGYSFYQSSYDQKNGHYTILSVTSDSGLILVFGGYFLLCAGVIWQCWLRHVRIPGGARS